MKRALALWPALILSLLITAPRPAAAWGPALHAYVNYQAREQAKVSGQAWSGLDLQAYITGAPAPDLWYASEETKLTVPAGIEENWEYVQLMFAESKNIRQASFTLGYAGHIVGDVRGHQVYLAAGTGNFVHHLIRDTSAAFVLFGAYEGYAHYKMPLDLVIGWGLDTTKGLGTDSGKWDNEGFDEELVSLMVRAGDRWCADKAKTAGKPVKGCPVSAAVIRKLRDYHRFAVNTVAHSLSFPGYYAEQSTAAANAKLVKGYDDTEWGVGKGPAKLNTALKESTSQTAQRLFFKDDIKKWIAASGLSSADQERFYNGAPPTTPPDAGPGDAGSGEGAKLVAQGSGCAMAGNGGGAWALLTLGLLLARRRIA